MPKVSEYELEHYNDDNFQYTEKVKKRKPQKEEKYSPKKDYRADWRKRNKVAKESIVEEDDFDD